MKHLSEINYRRRLMRVHNARVILIQIYSWSMYPLTSLDQYSSIQRSMLIIIGFNSPRARIGSYRRYKYSQRCYYSSANDSTEGWSLHKYSGARACKMNIERPPNFSSNSSWIFNPSILFNIHTTCHKIHFFFFLRQMCEQIYINIYQI